MRHELTEGEARLLVVLFPHLEDLDLEHVEDLGETARITARTRTVAGLPGLRGGLIAGA